MPGFFCSQKKNANAVVILTLLGTAQPISMQLNDLSLKPRDTFEQSRFIPSQRPCTLKFFATLSSGQKTSIPLFSTPFARPMDSREIRRLRALPDHAYLLLQN